MHIKCHTEPFKYDPTFGTKISIRLKTSWGMRLWIGTGTFKCKVRLLSVWILFGLCIDNWKVTKWCHFGPLFVTLFNGLWPYIHLCERTLQLFTSHVLYPSLWWVSLALLFYLLLTQRGCLALKALNSLALNSWINHTKLLYFDDKAAVLWIWKKEQILSLHWWDTDVEYLFCTNPMRVFLDPVLFDTTASWIEQPPVANDLANTHMKNRHIISNDMLCAQGICPNTVYTL